jgi:hypothetical protein
MRAGAFSHCTFTAEVTLRSTFQGSRGILISQQAESYASSTSNISYPHLSTMTGLPTLPNQDYTVG